MLNQPFLLASFEYSCLHCYKSIKCPDKEINLNSHDRIEVFYLFIYFIFLRSDFAKIKGNISIPFLKSFVPFYKNHERIFLLL